MNDIVDPFGVLRSLSTQEGEVRVHSLPALAHSGFPDLNGFPFSIKILLESVLRSVDGRVVTEADVRTLLGWNPRKVSEVEIPFMPARVLLQDFTGVPALVDLAAMRDAMRKLGSDPRKINPLIPVDLVIDHSVQVDAFGSAMSLGINAEKEFERNRERYEFLRWGQSALRDFRVVPPATGIVHQVNLEYLAGVVNLRRWNGATWALPDSVVGTDSHTTMINGLGVLGWGVGGIEAEAVMLGQPYSMVMPEVVGCKLTGRLHAGATATDLVLTVTERLRKKGVVGKFVEFFGSGLAELSVADRATVANMAPEYGATTGFFPVDAETLNYLRQTARPAAQVDLVERYTKEQGLFRTDQTPDPVFHETLELDLGCVEPSVAGPKRPQDRVPLTHVKRSFEASLRAPIANRGFGLDEQSVNRHVDVRFNGHSERLTHGSVVIAAITSCTNTSNPSVMVAAGLVARRAVEKGLRVKPYVKTSLAPGSRVVTDYLQTAGLMTFLEKLGFHVVGYGCTTCIGNSGPLPDAVAQAVQDGQLVVSAVLSGNRNFEGRVHSQVKANYLASPPLVVAYALAGSTDVDLTTEPLGTAADGSKVFLRDLWPTPAEVNEVIRRSLTSKCFEEQYRRVFEGNEQWNQIQGRSGDTYAWDSKSTYIQNPPFLEGISLTVPAIAPIQGARVLVMVGDSITTDHISPAGSIKPDSPAGKYLVSLGVGPADFNSYGSRRGNDRVMTRGTFANTRLRNLLAPGTEGGVTTHLPSAEVMPIYNAALRYRDEKTPLMVLAGKEYGTGSSRDWAAKGTVLLGVRAVLAESYERIHRSNLVGMGVLPLQYGQGESRESLGIAGHECFDVMDLNEKLRPRQEMTLRLTDPKSGSSRTVTVVSRIDSAVEVEYYRNGGILPAVLRKLAT